MGLWGRYKWPYKWADFPSRDFYKQKVRMRHVEVRYESGQMEEYFSNLDFPEIRGFPFLSYSFGFFGRVRSLDFDQINHDKSLSHLTGVGVQRSVLGRPWYLVAGL